MAAHGASDYLVDVAGLMLLNYRDIIYIRTIHLYKLRIGLHQQLKSPPRSAQFGQYKGGSQEGSAVEARQVFTNQPDPERSCQSMSQLT